MRYTIDNQPAQVDWEAKGNERRILQNAKNLLMTHMGEVPYDRYRGLDPAIYDKPLSIAQGEVAQELDRIMAWEPGVDVVEVRAYLDTKRGFVIEADVELVEADE